MDKNAFLSIGISLSLLLWVRKRMTILTFYYPLSTVMVAGLLNDGMECFHLLKHLLLMGVVSSVFNLLRKC